MSARLLGHPCVESWRRLSHLADQGEWLVYAGHVIHRRRHDPLLHSPGSRRSHGVESRGVAVSVQLPVPVLHRCLLRRLRIERWAELDDRLDHRRSGRVPGLSAALPTPWCRLEGEAQERATRYASLFCPPGPHRRKPLRPIYLGGIPFCPSANRHAAVEIPLRACRPPGGGDQECRRIRTPCGLADLNYAPTVFSFVGSTVVGSLVGGTNLGAVASSRSSAGG